MSFLSDMDKSTFTTAIDRIIMAKILWNRRRVYPSDKTPFYTNEPFMEDCLWFLLHMIELGTGWEVIDVDTEDPRGFIYGYMKIPELRELFQYQSNFKKEHSDKFDYLIGRYLNDYFDDDYGMFDASMTVCTDGMIRIKSEMIYGRLRGLLTEMLDLHDQLKQLLKAVRKYNAKEGVA